MKHLGDITKIKGSDVEIVDIITGGSPCQDLSVAGKRKGLAGERSGLFMEQIRIVKEMRDESRRNMGADVDIRLLKPRFMVWENVQGAFSSNNGEDFRCVLEETAKVVQGDAIIPGPANGKWSHSGCIMGDGWSIAWRLHDAQFWGVPQRRKRISLVADFAGGALRKYYLSEKACQGILNRAERRGKELPKMLKDALIHQASLSKLGGGVDTDSNGRKAGKGALIQEELSGTLGVSQDQTLVCFEPGIASRVGGHIYEDDKSATIRANAGDNALAVAYGISSYDSNAMKSSNPHSGIYEADTSRTLDLNGGNPGCNQGGIAVVQGADVYNGALTGEIAATLTEACGGTNTSGAKVVCLKGNGSPSTDTGSTLCIDQGAEKQQCGEPVVYDASRRHEYEPFEDICETVQAHYGTGGVNVPMVMEQDVKTYQKCCGTVDCGIAKGTSNQLANQDMFVSNGAIVRRLTPMECERLQGFPDGWTDIGDWIDSKGKKHKGDSDSPRYKALGNSIALPFWQWMAERMVNILHTDGTEEPSMASLFDGIGGFPLVYSRCGCKPIWASEIEEFPIAVTKIRFPSN